MDLLRWFPSICFVSPRICYPKHIVSRFLHCLYIFIWTIYHLRQLYHLIRIPIYARTYCCPLLRIYTMWYVCSCRGGSLASPMPTYCVCIGSWCSCVGWLFLFLRQPQCCIFSHFPHLWITIIQTPQQTNILAHKFNSLIISVDDIESSNLFFLASQPKITYNSTILRD